MTTRLIFVVLAILCFMPQISGGIALLAGIAFALTSNHPFKPHLKAWTTYTLQAGVIGLGAGTKLPEVLAAGTEGIVYTFVGISTTMALGLFLGRRLGNSSALSILISAGTAICGGSAIAATAAAIRAKPDEISVSLALVFALNAFALFVFPSLGHMLNLSELQFGYWSALAIHDTSSVVGAAMAYGPSALQTATTLKLARALWIIPLALTAGYLSSREDGSKRRLKLPWFIAGFVLMAALASYTPGAELWAPAVNDFAKRLLVLALFLIGTSVDAATIRKAGKPALALALTLWILVSLGSLGFVLIM